ncbi:heavy-metal-associated domain-containing protein [Limnobacter sp.]|mgnify:FL=1|jgi:copper chaperone
MTPPWRLPGKVHALELRLTPTGVQNMITLSVEKVKCGGCAANVKQAVLAKDPQAQVQVDVANKQVEIDSRLDGHTLATIVSQAGYPATLQA